MVAVISRVFYGGSVLGGGFRGRWNPDLAYRSGDVVVFERGVFGATEASAGVLPVTSAHALTGTPGDLATADGSDYEFVAYFQVAEPVRVTGLCFYKSTLQAQVSHLLSLWDRDVSTTVPLASTSTTESGGFTGVVVAPLVADLVPGRRYAVSLGTGAGTDTGYARTTGASLPVVSGPIIITGFGFSTVVGSIGTVTTGSTNFWVWPQYEVPATSWGLVGRVETAVAGNSRTLSATARPDPLACRPNDGTGCWPDASNTGHFGSVTDYVGGMTASGWVPVQVADRTIITGKRFLGKAGIGYDGVGDDLVFRNCLFEATQPNDNLVQIYCPTKVTFENCTFKPAGLSAPPGNDGTVSSASSSPGTTYAQSWQYIARMVPGQSTFTRCNIWGGAGIQATGGPDVDGVTTFHRCYIHDCADNDGSGGSGYHHDGPGPNTEGGGHDTVIDECTITSLGNTQGIAFQGTADYNRVTVQGCYLSGWGYALSLGNIGTWVGSNIRVLRNVWSAELATLFGPYYGGWRTGHGNLWVGNRFQVRGGDAASGWTTSSHGAYWWPSDNVAHPVDYPG